MSVDQRFTLLLTVIAVLIIPTLGLMIRIIVKWTRVEARLEELTADMKELVESKDEVHREIAQTIREDRAATDKRLRWLEEHLWKRDSGASFLSLGLSGFLDSRVAQPRSRYHSDGYCDTMY